MPLYYMQRFTYTEPQTLTEVEPQENLVLCMGACNTSVPEARGKLINNEFYCDDCRVCCSCGEPAIMDDGNGLVCSPSREAEETQECPRCEGVGRIAYEGSNGYAHYAACRKCNGLGDVKATRIVCNGSLQDAEEADEAAKDQLDWDNRAYRG